MRVIILFILAAGFSFSVNAQPPQELQSQIDSLFFFIKNKGTESFAMNAVYHGTDNKRNWKDCLNPDNPEELKAAKQLLNKMKNALNDCSYREFDTYHKEKESEGEWHIYTYACGADKKVHLAFLKIKGKYALGDVDVVSDDE
jgi:hypothetical protein